MFALIWNNVLYYPVLNLLLVLYNILFDNLGLAIIAIAIIFRLLLIPLIKKQTEMTKKMASLKPQLDELQKKYKNNPEKLSQEQIKLYKKVGYNPLGCFVTFFPQLIIFSVLFQAIRNIANNDLTGVYPFVKDWVFGAGDVVINTRFLVWDLARRLKGDIDKDLLKQIKDFLPLSPREIIEKYMIGKMEKEKMIIFSNYGILNQYGIKSIHSIFYIILALLVGVSQYFASEFMQRIQNPQQKKKKKVKKEKKEKELSPEEMQQKMMQNMNYMFPLMTVYISLTAPAALSLYWLVQSAMLVLQYILLNKGKEKEKKVKDS